MTHVKWKCGNCDWRGQLDQVLTAESPFDPEIELWGCPRCKEADCLTAACDEADCWREASCGWPQTGGAYRHTCGVHMRSLRG